ncbi:sulfotransferase [Fulvivirgaceae bacterium BMA10]|uniref:Sulfotransferase n=1 Tax=Splendidivirga corallicola TaxID=3051826 RepID=A0ABT8KSV3_9BACT|nr:sulfotransferase [Fulvivirgaceae bacterium BMA10]
MGVATLKRIVPFLPLFNFLIVLIKRGPIQWRKLKNLVPYFAKFTLLEPFRISGEIIHFFRSKNEVKNPLFVLGFYGSGTSYLQHLINQDPQFATLTLWDSMVPELLYFKKITQPAFDFASKKIKMKNEYHRLPFDWNFPGECDVAINSEVAVYDFNQLFQFPSKHQSIIEEHLDFGDLKKAQRSWTQHHKHLISRISNINKGNRLVLKSPPNTARISMLKEIYPEAKFVFLKRNLFDTIIANKTLWKLNKIRSFQRYDTNEIETLVMKLYIVFHKQYLKQRNALQPDELIEIDFESLADNPLKTLFTIYDTLQIPGYTYAQSGFKSLITERADFPRKIYSYQQSWKNKIEKECGQIWKELNADWKQN